MKAKSLLWKVPLALLGILTGLLVLLLIAVAVVLYEPSVRERVQEKGIAIVNEKTDWDIDLGRLYLSPFHHSPKVLYRAYKGETDLPVHIEIDSLFVGHRGKDTLVYVHALRLKARLPQAVNQSFPDDWLTDTIKVEQLRLERTTFHSGSLIKTVGVDAMVGLLDVASPGINIAKCEFPLHQLRLFDADVAIDLRSKKDTTKQDTATKPLMFDIPDGDLRNIHFRLMPTGLDIQTNELAVNALVDVGHNLYDVRRLDVSRLALSIGKLCLPFDTICGDAKVDLKHSVITSGGLYARSDSIGATADIHTTALDLATMRVQVIADADFRGSKARLRGFYDIDDEQYDLNMDIDRVNLSPFLKDSTLVVVAGHIQAKGKGLALQSYGINGQVGLNLTDCIYDSINVSGIYLNADIAGKTVNGTLHLPVAVNDNNLKVKAQTEHQFRVTNFLKPEQMEVDYHTQMHGIKAYAAGEHFRAEKLLLDFATDSLTTLDLTTNGLTVNLTSPMHVLKLANRIPTLLHTVCDTAVIQPIVSFTNLSMLDMLRQSIPQMDAHILLTHGSPVQGLIERFGLDLDRLAVRLRSNEQQTLLSTYASIPDIEHPGDSSTLRLPASQAGVNISLSNQKSTISLIADSRLKDGVMSLHGLKTNAALQLNLEREQNKLNGTGQLVLSDLAFGDLALGNRSVDITVSPSKLYANAFRADVRLDDLPLSLVDSLVHLTDINLTGSVQATAGADGLPAKLDLSAEVLPLGVSALYKPYDVKLCLGETPIVMEHNRVELNGLPVYGEDSTFIALTGGIDLNSMRLNVKLEADSFAPIKLVKDGPIPVYGDLATDIHGSVTGSLDSILADVDITILPTTDITYPIDKKNLAQVKPHGTVNLQYAVADSVPLRLGGTIHVDDGIVRYSPKAYPIIPFHVDSGSVVAFQGPLGKTHLNVSASQEVKADVDSKSGGARRVTFQTGVRVKGELDSIGIHSIGFFLEAPGDEAVSRELAAADEDTREGLAAVLLTTGMYLGESNDAAQRDNYAFSSIVNSRINAAIANSKMGKFMDVDFGAGKKNDMNITLSKSFFHDKLRITVGSTISDNPEVNETKGLLSSVTADYKLNKQGNVLLRLYSRRDNNNVLEGELYKSGLGVRAGKDWQRQNIFRGDSLVRTHSLSGDAGVAYRSNNSIGPDVNLKYAIKNLMGRGESFTLKGNGAYYFSIRSRQPGDPKKSDTYKMGLNASLLFPYLHWGGDNNPDGDTRYMLGYQYENIAGGYGVHKISGSFTYFFHSSRYITHAFTPFSLSVVQMKAEADNLLDKAAEFPQLIKVIAGDEFVPSVGYNFTYNNYRSKRAVNTMLDLGFKESGNLLNAIYCAFGRKWNEKGKPLGALTFNQFVRLTAELRNRYNLTDKVSIATRLYAGANIPLGNSHFAPLSEGFYAGGPNSMRSASPYAYGPGNFYSAKYSQNFFHVGDVKLEANVELRFPLFWKVYGAAFVDAGNVWNWYSTVDLFKAAGFEDYLTRLQIPESLHDGLYDNPDFARQIALGTGAGLRLDLDGLVVRLDFGVGIHAPYQTFKYNKDGKPDYTRPINTYYNIPSFLDAVRVNFGIGYPF